MINTIKFSAFSILILLLTANQIILSQSNDTVKPNNSYVFRLTPSVKDNIYGIALGPLGSEVICNVPNTKKSHGLNIQLIGQGFFIPFNPKAFGYKHIFGSPDAWMINQLDSVKFRAKHNGLLIATFGSMTEISNGVVLSAGFSLGYHLNGVGINLFASKYAFMNGLSIAISNESYDAKGVQIGLINRSVKLTGFQFGFWNVNEKRKLPLLNWSF